MTDQVKTAGIAIWSMVLGILGLTCAGPLGAIPAIVCGHIGISRNNKASGLTGNGMAIAGLVMGYIGLVLSLLILPALLIPAVAGGIRAGRSAQAQNEIRGIQTAVTAYYNEYGRVPQVRGNAELIEALTGANPRQIVFLEVDMSSLDDGALVDPWSEAYAIALDFDDADSVTVGDQTLPHRCAVWSYGPNRQDEKGMGDDLVSWR